MKDAIEKRKSDTKKLLQVMRSGRWINTAQMIRAGTHRFSARIYDLRKLGCVIVTQRTSIGAIYRLLKGPAQRSFL
jgi:succinate dehydrogenase/fumarate reductase flavoprotein subunit